MKALSTPLHMIDLRRSLLRIGLVPFLGCLFLIGCDSAASDRGAGAIPSESRDTISDIATADSVGREADRADTLPDGAGTGSHTGSSEGSEGGSSSSGDSGDGTTASDAVAGASAGSREASSGTPAARAPYRAGEDPVLAAEMGWPVVGPEPRPGALLPNRRIIAYYGNPLSRRMGVLGEYDPEEMLRRLDVEVAAWNEADPSTPAIPALHLVAVVAQAEPGVTGKYRTRMRDTLVERVSEWADTRDALVFLDVQVGTGTLQEELPRLMTFMARENFHLGIDPEFAMQGGARPGTRIGTLDAADINYAIDLLAQVVEEHDLPPKVLVIHRFTRRMVTNAHLIKLDPRVQVVIHMDGWGAPWLKRDTYRDVVVREPVQFAGIKLFYHNDTKAGDPLMTPADMLRLHPVPFYIQYQ